MPTTLETGYENLGYASRSYIESLSEFGQPYFLRHSAAYLLQRTIPGSVHKDLMGAYPVFSCLNWANLKKDIAHIKENFVSITLVSDAFADISFEQLREIFPDKCRPFKKHFCVNLDMPLEKTVSANHRYKARRANKNNLIHPVNEPHNYLETWNTLYQNLINRHGIKGIQAFSERSFAKLFSVPGVKVFLATQAEEPVGMQVWLRKGHHAYYHLAAYTDNGYKTAVSYAMFWFILLFFRKDGVNVVNLGAGAGASDESDGLTRFKRGWSNETRQVYLCGKVLDRRICEKLTCERNAAHSMYFPQYRDGEMI